MVSGVLTLLDLTAKDADLAGHCKGLVRFGDWGFTVPGPGKTKSARFTLRDFSLDTVNVIDIGQSGGFQGGFALSSNGVGAVYFAPYGAPFLTYYHAEIVRITIPMSPSPCDACASGKYKGQRSDAESCQNCLQATTIASTQCITSQAIPHRRLLQLQPDSRPSLLSGGDEEDRWKDLVMGGAFKPGGRTTYHTSAC